MDADCEACYGTGGLYDAALGIDDKCAHCDGGYTAKASLNDTVLGAIVGGLIDRGFVEDELGLSQNEAYVLALENADELWERLNLSLVLDEAESAFERLAGKN